MMKLTKYMAALGVLMLFSGCAIPRSRPSLPYDANNPLKRVAVLPMKNDTTDVDGPEVLRKKMVKALEDHSYIVKDLKETDQILRDRMGITLGGQLDMTTAKKLGEELGVEGVLYGNLLDFDETTTGAINIKKVRGKFKLVNAMTGQTLWARGLGVRSEIRMEGSAGEAATIVARAADSRDKDVPWVTIGSTTTGSDKLGESFAIGLGTKLVSKAFGVHLDRESTELARRVTEGLPWGPGTSAAAAVPVSQFAMPEIKMAEPPSFGYMDWEGKREFSAVVYSTSLNKNRNESFTMEIPMAVAGHKMRMDMDMSRMLKGDTQSSFSKLSVIERGDKKIMYTLYPNTQQYLVHTEKKGVDEKPQVEKIRVGSETIGRYQTDKYRVKIMYKDGKVEEGFIWNAGELDGMTVKSEVENKDYKVSTEIRNIILKTPHASLFEIPDGYREAQSFMDIMAAEPKNK